MQDQLTKRRRGCCGMGEQPRNAHRGRAADLAAVFQIQIHLVFIGKGKVLHLHALGRGRGRRAAVPQAQKGGAVPHVYQLPGQARSQLRVYSGGKINIVQNKKYLHRGSP